MVIEWWEDGICWELEDMGDSPAYGIDICVVLLSGGRRSRGVSGAGVGMVVNHM